MALVSVGPASVSDHFSNEFSSVKGGYACVRGSANAQGPTGASKGPLPYVPSRRHWSS